MSEGQLLDLETIDMLRALQPQGAADLIGELLDMFLKTAPPLLEQMRVAAAQNNSEALAKSAHALKGNSAALGAVALAERAKQVEMLGRMKNLQDAANQVALVEQEYARAIQALEQLRDK